MKLSQLEHELNKKNKFQNKYDLALEIASMITEARIVRGITQKKLAKLVGTGQSSIARAENGAYLPSLSFLNRIAEKLNTELRVNFKMFESIEVKSHTHALTHSYTGEQSNLAENLFYYSTLWNSDNYLLGRTQYA